MPLQVIGKSVLPPDGWHWDAEKNLRPRGDFSELKFKNLYAWAKHKGFGLEPVGSISKYTPEGLYASIWCIFKVWKDSWEITEKYLGDGNWSGDFADQSIGKLELRAFGSVHWNRCTSCDRHGLKLRKVAGVGGRTSRLCAFCSSPCSKESCDAWTFQSHYLGDRGECLSCLPRFSCHFCKSLRPNAEAETVTNTGKKVCKACADIRRCSDCKIVQTSGSKTLNGERYCDSCYGIKSEAERAKHESFSPEELPKGNTLTLTSLPNRPVRVVSIETEVNGNSSEIATTLYNAGLVPSPYLEAYTAVVPETSALPAFFKRDGSVTGGELITYLLQLDKTEHAEVLKTILSKVRSLEKTGHVEFANNCGGHIHIDAHNFSDDNLWRLLTGYNYLEDVIFRLAGAGHTYGHRSLSLQDRHAPNGHGYSNPTSKGPWGLKSGAFRAAAEQNRHTGLNFVPYFKAIRYCECGANAKGNLRECKCHLPKCTIEWRVWNSQGNPRILHAWIAFMQALHSWADTPKEMTSEEEADYPPLAWTRLPWGKTTAKHKEAVLERIKWIFINLVFSPEERDSLLYAFQQTDITFPVGFISELEKIPQPRNRTVKAPRNCAMRLNPIKVSPPKTKLYGSISPKYSNRTRLERARFVR